MQQGVSFQNVLENVLKIGNSNSIHGIYLALESTKHIDLRRSFRSNTRLYLFGQVPILASVNIDLKLPVNPEQWKLKGFRY